MTELRHKRGDIREDGMVFWAYDSGYASGERWLPPASFERRLLKARETSALFNKQNAEHVRARSAAYYVDNKEGYLKSCAKYYEDNKDEIKRRRSEYQSLNKAAFLERRREYDKRRRASNPLFLVATRMRARMNAAFRSRGYNNKTSTASIIGCSFEELKAHIEHQFTEGMSWENRSEWHIDHIRPLASATTEEELLALCHFTNLQPLWAKDNLSKGSKIPLNE